MVGVVRFGAGFQGGGGVDGLELAFKVGRAPAGGGVKVGRTVDFS